MKFKNWYERTSSNEIGGLDEEKFLKIADRFINLANSLNKKTIASDLHYAFLFSSARYSAHVGKNVMEVENQEHYIDHLVNQYRDMLRENFADPVV